MDGREQVRNCADKAMARRREEGGELRARMATCRSHFLPSMVARVLTTLWLPAWARAPHAETVASEARDNLGFRNRSARGGKTKMGGNGFALSLQACFLRGGGGRRRRRREERINYSSYLEIGGEKRGPGHRHCNNHPEEADVE